MQLDIKQPLNPVDAPADAAPMDADSARWMEFVKAGVLLGLAGYFVYNIVGGDLANYINLRFMWLTYVALFLFTLLGVITVIGILRRDYNNVTSDHTTISWHVILVMALPLVLGTLIPSQPLGASAVRDNLSFQAASFGTARVAQKDPLDRNVLDWGRAFAEPGVDPSAFDDLPADFVGFVISEPTFPEGYVVIARSVVRCCVVDIEGVGIPAAWADAHTLRDDQWVRVQGTFTAGIFQDQRTPILHVTSIEVVSQPEQPYLYP